jgi:hypothetical protein
MGRDALSDQGRGADDGVIADLNAVEHFHSGADPGPIANRDAG